MKFTPTNRACSPRNNLFSRKNGAFGLTGFLRGAAMQSSSASRSREDEAESRNGSALVVVIALLGALMLLGFLILSVSSSSETSSEYFADNAKRPHEPRDYFDFAVKRLIMGARQDEYNSALYGGRGSMLANMLGRDMSPFSGQGVNLIWDGVGAKPVVDLDQDGVEDVGAAYYLDYNTSRGANPTGLDGGTYPWGAADDAGLAGFPNPDVDHTRPDNNAPFLAYYADIPDGVGGTNKVWIPSFHRPQYLRDAATSTWFTAVGSAPRVLRPHQEHMAVAADGTVTPEYRFVSHAHLDPGNDDLNFNGIMDGPETDGGDGVFDIGLYPFSYSPATLTLIDDGFTVSGSHGLWTTPVPGILDDTFDLMADPDGDGVNDAVYVDLHHRPQVSADGQRTFVPMYAFTVISADSLLNLNVHGNKFGDLAMGVPAFGNGNAISLSNQAVSASEVNPEWALYADPTTAAVGELNQYQLFFGNAPADATELANMDWWFLLSGRAEFNEAVLPALGTVNDIQILIPGRQGELDRLENGIAAAAPHVSTDFSWAGRSYDGDPALADDNHDRNETGLTAGVDSGFDSLSGSFPVNTVPAQIHPVDLLGTGTYLDATGKIRQVSTLGRNHFAIYEGYETNDDLGYVNAIGFSTWTSSTPYVVGQRVVRTGGGGPTEMYICVAAGTTGGAEPVWPAPPSTVIDGSVTWQSELRLMPFRTTLSQFDDESETISNFVYATAQSTDWIFPASENAGLHFSPIDFTNTGIGSRLRQLAPFNFSSSAQSAAIRSQFTTSSFDLKTNGWAAPLISHDLTTPIVDKFRTWEFNVDIDGDLFGDAFPPQFGLDATPVVLGSAADPFRQELRALLATTRGGVYTKNVQRRLSLNGVLDADDSDGDGNVFFDDDGDGTIFLDADGDATSDSFERTEQLFFRPLTPHSVGLAATPVTNIVTTWQASTAYAVGEIIIRGRIAHRCTVAGTSGAAAPAWAAVVGATVIDSGVTWQSEWAWDTPHGQESMARRDRQKMCRDLYVMLYTFGGGDDSFDYTTANDTNQLYTAAQMQEMAQFAVNAVDSLDSDYTMTVFEYDIDLGNGWGLDDDPFTDDLGDRAVVVGVEAQQLALNEALALFCHRFDNLAVPANHDSTEIDDSDHRDFWFLELENVSLQPVSFATGAWQVVVKPADVPSQTYLEERRLTFLANTPTVGAGALSRMTIGTAGDNHNVDSTPDLRDSRFYVDPVIDGDRDTMAGAPIQIAPVTAGPPTLDLMRPDAGSPLADPANYYRVSQAPAIPTSAGEGTTVLPNTAADPSGRDLLYIVPAQKDTLTGNTVNVRIELRRRVDLSRTAPVTFETSALQHENESLDNPWVTVDDMVVEIKYFDIPDDTPNGAGGEIAVRTQLEAGPSSERRQPLHNPPTSPLVDVTVPPPAVGSGGEPTNTLGAVNDAVGVTTENSLWQQHVDRQYTSTVELFNLPLYGPDRLTQLIGQDDVDPATTWEEASIAGSKFLHPDVGTLGTSEPIDNRWYRLLELVEIPTRHMREYERAPFTVNAGSIGSEPDALSRVPGGIDINTVRHPAVLAGIMDDPSILAGFSPTTPPYLTDASEAGRDWFAEFLLSRDGVDADYTGLNMPGLPYNPAVGYGRPFRNMGYASNSTDSIEDTLLRALPLDLAPADPTDRRLFEIGTKPEHDADTIDPTVRHRMLQKVLNNTTTRSNVFLVWIQVDYFESRTVENPPGTFSVRVGSKLPDSPGNRMFFVIDRSKAMNLVTPGHLPAPGTFSFDTQDPTSQTFDYQSLILHRETIE